ncbi:T9SS type A sorting domain-containing protein [Nubsella zeaxanthinifaciens]|uniref:T9SS type A sorting domain-containing protein n=1 Tax=Nubsella zeaxanthinifaciens TaxID=392412 RepID=UPI000DE3E905|nr:T9SS type A sorting domain-containing protein [Nubsella zeaxanthinifaciens]
MKRQFPFLLAVSAFFISVCAFSVNAQVYTATDYYYNNFDGGQLGTGITQTSTSASLAVSNSSPISGTYSLSSTGNGSAGTYKIAAVNSGTALGDQTFGWEWTFNYKNTQSTVDASNTWKYWLVRESDQSSSSGCYITQIGNRLSLIFYLNANNTWSFQVPVDLVANKTYAIRVQRLKQHGGWVIYMDDAALAVDGAYTQRVATGWYPSGGATYNSSLIELTSASAGRFAFDELKMYSMKLQVVGANASSNGISNPLYAGQQNAVIYGLQFQTRGYFDIYQFKVDLSGSITSIIDRATVKIKKSTDSFFGNADDTQLVSLASNDVFDAAIQYYGSASNPFARFWSVGAADGSVGNGGYLFLSANVLSTANNSNTFAVTGAPLLQGASSGSNYSGTSGTVVNPTTPASASGKVYDWIGATSVWSSNTNWRLSDDSTPATAPTANDFVRIGVNKTYTQMPTIATSTAIGNLTIGGTNGNTPTITVNSNVTLTVNGAFTNSRASNISGSGNLVLVGNWTTSGGKINLTSGTVGVTFNSANDQLIQDNGSDAGNGVMFGTVTFTGGATKTLSGTGKFAVAINKFLTVGPNTILQTSGILTLKSSADGAASVATIPSTSSIRGLVTVEKYIQGGNKNMWRTNRLLSSPVYDNTTAFTNANVDGGRKYSFTQFIDDMLITGVGGAANGFDVNTTNETSAWTYIGAFTPIPNINTSLNVGRGAFIYYRGDRSNVTGKFTAPYVDAESTVMTFKGNLTQQDVTVPLTGATLLGNPYAATIDWLAVTKTTNVGGVIKIWNPKNRQYSVFNGEYGINDGSRYIGSGQAFFVQLTNTAAASVTFTEASKVSAANQSSASFNRLMAVGSGNLDTRTMESTNNPVVVEPATKMRVQLSRDNTENSDETLVILRRGELATVAGYDVERSGGEAVFLSSLSAEGKKMAINYLPQVSEVPSLKLGVDVANNGNYTFTFNLEDLPTGYEAKLKDNYLNSITDISEGVEYSFVVDRSKAASFGNTRFEVLLAPVTTLPAVISNFSGLKKTEGVLLNWKTSSESNNSYFEIFRADDTQQYISIGKVMPNSSGNYNLLDKSPLAGNNYYKLVQVDVDGKATTYTERVAIKFDLNKSVASDVVVYPTQVQSTFTLKYNGSLTSNNYLINITDASGKEVYSIKAGKEEIINGAKGELSTVPTGVYFVTLLDTATSKKIGAAKLIKK